MVELHTKTCDSTGFPESLVQKEFNKRYLKYAVSGAAISGALLLRFLLDPFLGDHLPFVTFFVAVVIASWYGGLRSGLAATVLGFFLAWYFFVPPRLTLAGTSGQHFVGLFMYFMVSLAIAGFGGIMRTAQHQSKLDQQIANEQRQRAAALSDDLRKHIEELDVLLRVLPVGVFVSHDIASTHITMNPAGAEMLGLPVDANASKTGPGADQLPFRVLKDGVEVPNEELPMQRAARTGETVRGEILEIERDDRSTRCLYEYAVPLYNEKGEIRGSLGAFVDITERKQIEEALRHSEQRFRSVFNQQFQFMALLSPEGKVQEINDLPLKVADVKREDILGKFFWDTPWWEGLPDMKKNWPIRLSEAARAQGPILSEDRFLAAKGEIRLASAAITAVKDDKDQVEFFIVQATDITDRKRAEAKVKESEERFRYLADSVPVLIWMSDTLKAGVYFNKTWLDFTGRSLEEECGEGWLSHIHSDDIETGLAPCSEAFSQRKPFQTQFRLKRSDGEYRWMLDVGVPRFSSDNEFLGYIGSCVDITERKISEEALFESEQRFRSIFENAAIGISEVSLKGDWLRVNDRLCEITGYQREELLSKNFSEITHPDDVEEDWKNVYRLLSGELNSYSMEKRYINKDESVVPIHLTVSLARDIEGKPKHFISIIEDITDRKEVKEALIEARNKAEEANQAKSEFLANMSHELRTPLNAVVGLSCILNMDKTLSGKQKEIVNTLQLSSQSLLTLINDLLDIAKIETNQINLENIPFNFDGIFDEVLYVLKVNAEEKGITLECVRSPLAQQYFLGDPLRIRQILMNLVSNAVKFTEKGSVIIGISSSPHEDAGSMYVHVSVKDTGIGIAENKLESIFEKFTQSDTSTTRKYGGTGLGLAISKSLAEIMSGSVTVKSHIGSGSEFTLHLPLELANEISMQAIQEET